VAYDWPGNVRELDNEIKKLILLAGPSDVLQPDILSAKIVGENRSKSLSASGIDVSLGHATEFGGQYSLYDFLARHERQFIVQALKERNGVKKHAAALLNIPESSLRLKIKEYNIDLDRLDSIN